MSGPKSRLPRIRCRKSRETEVPRSGAVIRIPWTVPMGGRHWEMPKCSPGKAAVNSTAEIPEARAACPRGCRAAILCVRRFCKKGGFFQYSPTEGTGGRVNKQTPNRSVHVFLRYRILPSAAPVHSGGGEAGQIVASSCHLNRRLVSLPGWDNTGVLYGQAYRLPMQVHTESSGSRSSSPPQSGVFASRPRVLVVTSPLSHAHHGGGRRRGRLSSPSTCLLRARFPVRFQGRASLAGTETIVRT